MKAHEGDWLVVHSHNDGGHVRRAEIIGTRDDGTPPYTVRWIDDDRTSVIFPGPDAQVVSAAQQAEHDRAESALIDRLQNAIETRSTSSHR
jgi:hypothetical protein